MKTAVCLVLIAVFGLTGGCADMSTYRKTLDINEGAGVTMDIKQRAILVTKDKTTGRIKACAEPSPEAMSSVAAQFASELNIPDTLAAKLVASFTEGTSFVGLRTQSIQLLRDTAYQLCQANMNGSLSDPEYNILLRRFQKYTVALLAVEQLTGTLRVPPVNISTQSTAEAARSLSELMTEIEKIDENLAEVDKKLKDPTEKSNKLKTEIETTEKEIKDFKPNPPVTDEDKQKLKQLEDKLEQQKKDQEDLTTQIKNLNDQKSKLNKNKDLIGKAIENARGLVASGQVNVNVSSVGEPYKPTPDQIKSVAKTVEKIVMSIINTDDTGQLCLAFMTREAFSGQPKSDPQTQVQKEAKTTMLDICNSYFAAYNTHLSFIRSVLADLIAETKKCKDSDCVIKMLELISNIAGSSSQGFMGFAPPAAARAPRPSGPQQQQQQQQRP